MCVCMFLYRDRHVTLRAAIHNVRVKTRYIFLGGGEVHARCCELLPKDYTPTHNPRPTTHMHHNPRYLRHEASERQAASTQQLTRQLTAGRMRTAHAASPWVAAHAPTAAGPRPRTPTQTTMVHPLPLGHQLLYKG